MASLIFPVARSTSVLVRKIPDKWAVLKDKIGLQKDTNLASLKGVAIPPLPLRHGGEMWNLPCCICVIFWSTELKSTYMQWVASFCCGIGSQSLLWVSLFDCAKPFQQHSLHYEDSPSSLLWKPLIKYMFYCLLGVYFPPEVTIPLWKKCLSVCFVCFLAVLISVANSNYMVS